jgi:glycosyltransferase involved in cell wall biosynthesis
MKISVISPVYNEEACVPELCRQLLNVLPPLAEDFEIILVDDGSRDGSWEVIRELGSRYSQIKGLRFSRNFGHHYAITAGLDQATGDWTVVMDSDLQDPPSAIAELMAKAREGYDVVLGRRRRRQFSWFKNISAKIFYCVFRYVTDSRYDGEAGVYRIMSRQVVETLRRLPEVDRFFPALVDWVGFRQGHIYVSHGKRYAGETKYPLRKQIALAVNAMLSFSDKPIVVIVYFGLTVAVLSLLYAAYIVLRGVFGTIAMLGYASIFTAVSFFGGMTIATLGLVGLYVGRIFRQVKGRPIYIVAELVNAAAEPQTAAMEAHMRTNV